MKMNEDDIRKYKTQEIIMVYKDFLKDYFKEDLSQKELSEFNAQRAILSLMADIEGVLIKADDIVQKSREITLYITSKISWWDAIELTEIINMAKIIESVEIRRNWETVLRKVRNSRVLSHKIGYCFYDSDIKKLAQLHKANKFRKKIEELLMDCNFHKECGDFSEGNYDEYLRETDTDDSSDR